MINGNLGLYRVGHCLETLYSHRVGNGLIYSSRHHSVVDSCSVGSHHLLGRRLLRSVAHRPLSGITDGEHHSHHCSSLEERFEVGPEGHHLGLHHLGTILDVLIDGCKHLLVEIISERCLADCLFLIFKQTAVFEKSRRHILLTEEGAQDGFLLIGGLAIPIAFEQLFNILIVHNLLFPKISF